MTPVCVLGRRLAAAALLLGSLSLSAQAQDLINEVLSILGVPRPTAPAFGSSTNNPAPLTVKPDVPWSFGLAGVLGYCVRTCDGRYFPIARFKGSGEAPAKLCQALCPASQTTFYWGSAVAQARTAAGSRYSDLPTAFYFRKQVVENCTCNGKSIFGMAAVNVENDRSLQSGDIVMTSDGPKIFIATTGRRYGLDDFAMSGSHAGYSAQNRALFERKLMRPGVPARPPMR